MKKKMTVVGGLLMAVVLTGYSVAGTYAKYTETASYSDSATIAKWDVTVGASSTQKLFNIGHNNATENNRVAPGGNDTATWNVSAKDNGSEVKVNVSVSMSIENGVQKEISKEHYDMLTAAGLTDVVYNDTETGKYYYAPVVFSVTKDGSTEKANNTKALEALFTDFTGGEFVIGWNWAFEAKNLVSTVSDEINTLVNTLDTALGKEHDENKKIQITATATAEQDTITRVDNYTVEIKDKANTDATDIAAFVNSWGYDETLTASVTFDGRNIGGTIQKSTNSTLLSKYPVTDPQGYYFPITITGTKGATFQIGGSKMKTLSIGSDGHTTVLMALDSVNKTPIKVVMPDGNTTTIDYAGLQFN